MAASLSRPDPTSPASVAEAGFSTSRRGYQPDEVRAFLASVAAEMSRLKERERQLEAELRAARAASTGRVELDEETVTNLLGEETLRVLQTARESASQIKIRAEENGARVMREAHEEANRLRQEAEVESARRRHDAQSDAEAELALAKQQGREMVNEARAYRERVLADLERRTKLARQHIEELTQGRDRLLQVFERARLVAVDVTSELQAIDGPDEFVSFAPTTGPVPLMVPASRLDEPRPEPSSAGGAAPSLGAGELDEPPPATGTDSAEPAADSADTISAGVSSGDAAAQTGHEVAREGAGGELAGSEAGEAETAADRDGTAAATETATDAATDTATETALDTGVDTGIETATEVTAEPEQAKPARDTNVVSLFRDRAGDELDADVTTEQSRSEVDGLFARLRSEVPPTTAPADATSSPAEELPEGDAAPVSTAFTRRDEALVPLIVVAARKIKRVLADEQNGVLDTLRRREPVTTVDAIVPGVDAHVASYLDAMAEELLAAAAAGAGELGAKDTKTLRRSLDKAGALDATRALVRTDLVGPLRSRIERAVVEGAGDNDDVTKRVRAVYREWKTQHIDDQLDDVFRFAFGGGLAVTVDPGTSTTWTIDPSQPACADCEDNSLAGALPAGESFPTGHTSAPAHPGCRCLTLPAQQ